MKTHNSPCAYGLQNHIGFAELVERVLDIIVNDINATFINYFLKERDYPDRCCTIRVTISPDEYKPTSERIDEVLFRSSLKDLKKWRGNKSVSEILEAVLMKKGKVVNPPKPIIIIPFPHDGSFEDGLRQLLKEDKPFDVFCIDVGSFRVRFYRFSNVLVEDDE